MPRMRAHVLVSGSVQGVNFRSSARREAQLNGVTGWVRNNPDGRVEAVFEGEEDAVRRVVAWCSHGPRGAWVEDVEAEWEAYTGEFPRFEIRLGGSW